MRSELRNIIDIVLEKHLGPKVTTCLVFNDNGKTLRRFKYVGLTATDEQLGKINYDLYRALPSGTDFVAYNHDSRSWSNYPSVAVRIFH